MLAFVRGKINKVFRDINVYTYLLAIAYTTNIYVWVRVSFGGSFIRPMQHQIKCLVNYYKCKYNNVIF